MKKIFVPKKIWQQLSKIKNDQDLASFSKVISYLINSQHVLKGENLQKIKGLDYDEKTLQNLEEKVDLAEIERYVDGLKPVKNLGEHDSSVIEFRCLRCNNAPFKIDESPSDETCIICPHCGYRHHIGLFRKDVEVT